MWIVFSLALSVLLALGSLTIAIIAARNAARAADSAARNSRLPESALQSLRESIQELGDTQLEMANRLKMMKVRAATSHTDPKPDRNNGLPDPYKDPEGWRQAMNSRLARGKVGLSQ